MLTGYPINLDPFFWSTADFRWYGLQVVLLGTRAPEAGFSNFATSVVMSGWFAGILLVQWLCQIF